MLHCLTTLVSVRLTLLAQVDSLSSRLTMLKEKIEATESLIALDLDQRRNELTAFDLVLTMVTLSVAFVSMIASIFGQNLYWSTTQSPLVRPCSRSQGFTFVNFMSGICADPLWPGVELG